VLAAWEQTSAEIATLVPGAARPARDIASAARYLVTNRELEPNIAGRFASWLESVVTPRQER
jgi:hypothetical protein